MTLDPSRLFETALVAADLDKTMAEMSATLGVTFAPVLESFLPMRTADGDAMVPLRCTYTLPAPHLEVIEAQAGTWLSTGENSTTLHHLGYFVEDLKAAAADLERAGAPMVACGFLGDSAPEIYTYHLTTFGVLIELVDGPGQETSFYEWMRGRVPEVPTA